VQDAQRIQDWEQTEASEEAVTAAWQRYGYDVTGAAAGGRGRRLKFLAQRIQPPARKLRCHPFPQLVDRLDRAAIAVTSFISLPRRVIRPSLLTRIPSISAVNSEQGIAFHYLTDIARKLSLPSTLAALSGTS
jgi:hypothetical protein